MKRFFATTLLLLTLLLSACGTLDVSVESTTTPTQPISTVTLPVPTDTPAQLTPVENCPPFAFENKLPDNPDAAESYIGHHYDDLNMPAGLEFRAAAMINDDYIWENVGRPDHQMYWLDKFVCRDLNGRAYYDIINTFNAPTEGGNYIHSDAGCVDSYGEDAKIFVAFGKYDLNQSPAPIDKWTMFDLDYAFKLDLANERFVEVPTTGLTCYHSIGLGSFPGSITPVVAQCPPFAFETALPQNPDVAESYIGHHYDELNMPSGLEFRAAAVIDDVYNWVNVARSDHQMFWLEKFVCRDASGRFYADIVAALDAPRELGTYIRAYDTCLDANSTDSHILAFGKYDPNVTPAQVDRWALSDLDRAYHIDLSNERFVEVPTTTGLTCFRLIGGQ